MRTKVMYCFSCYLALYLKWYLQYSINITTEQSFRYMEFIDAKIWIFKMHHYVGFLQIGSHMAPDLKKCDMTMKNIKLQWKNKAHKNQSRKESAWQKLLIKKLGNRDYHLWIESWQIHIRIVKMIFHRTKFLSFHVLVWPFHSMWANEYRLEDYKYWLCKIS